MNGLKKTYKMEEIVSIETARLAKDKGFDVRVRKYFNNFDEVKVGIDATGPKEDWDYNTSNAKYSKSLAYN
jgi:hypothetical protein